MSVFLIYAWAASKWQKLPLIIILGLNSVTKAIIKYEIPFENNIWEERRNTMLKFTNRNGNILLVF